MNSAHSEGMDVTTADIMAFRKTVREDISAYFTYLDRVEELEKRGYGPEARLPEKALYVQEIERENEEALDIQLDALSKRTSVCTPGLSEKLEGHVDMEKLASEMGDNFLSYNYMRAAACSVYSTFRGISESSSNIAHLTALKNSVRNLHKIGEESAFGYVFTGTVGGASDLFVIKTARDEEAEADLTHELFVALMVLNELRKIMPHWTMYFGGFQCPEAIIDHETGAVQSYCGTAVGHTPYALCENISPSKSFGDVAMKCSVPEFYELLMQHLFATHIGSELVGYTHYDCHPGNCLIREIQVDGIKDQFCVPYTIGHETWYVRARKILTFIDYGMTSVTYQGVQIGAGQTKLEEFGVASGPWGLHDAYKVLGFIAYDLISSGANPKVLEEIRKIFTFFNKTEPLEIAIEKQYNLHCFFSLPKMQAIEHFTILDLISHIMQVVDLSDIVTREPYHPVLECTGCYSFAATIEGAYVRDPKPTNFYDFYEAAKHLGTTSKINYDRLVSSFDYQKAAAEFKKQVQTSVTETQKYLALEHLPELSRQPTALDLTDKKTYKEAQQAYIALTSAISHFEDVRIWLSVGNAVAILYNDRDVITFVNQQRQALSNIEATIIARINEIREFYRKISSVVSTREWERYRDRYPWYTVNSGEIMSLRARFDEAAKSDRFIEQRLPSALTRAQTPPPVTVAARRQPVPAVPVPGVLPHRRRVAVIRNADGVATGLNVM